MVAGAWVHVAPAEALNGCGFTAVPGHERRSSCDVEIVAPWRALQCLTPDATQLALGKDWSPTPYRCAPSATSHICDALFPY